MILMHNCELIFLKARKVGGTSFEIALSKYCDEKSIITPISKKDESKRAELGFRGPQNYQWSRSELKDIDKNRRQSKFFNHMSATSILNKVGGDIFYGYRKISIIRNPFDFAISLYFWEGRDKSLSGFESWCLDNKKRLLINNQQYKVKGNNVIDFFIRYDFLKTDILALESEVAPLKGLYDEFCSISAKANVRPKYASIDAVYAQAPKAKNIIYELHKHDIERFNFNIPG